MAKKKYSIVGVMSGTSLDGIDLVYAVFHFKRRWHFDVVNTVTIPYTNEWRYILEGLVGYSTKELHEIDKRYTAYLSTVIHGFIKRFDIKSVDAVCSHGHTALHRPENKMTYQIGNQPILAKLLKQTVVCDFRVQDVALGGQGAPLVPIGDNVLFPEFDFCLNLGGFANISTNTNGERIAYDICPVNIVLNHYVASLGFNYDDGGNIASTGQMHKQLLGALNALDFYQEPYPKSLGLEWVKEYVYPIIDTFNLEIKDVLCTFVEHIAIQIATEINKKDSASVLATGGGVYNSFLLNRLKVLTHSNIVVPSNAIVEFKEALIFGFLGVLRLRNEVNCLQSVTGASKNHSSGEIYYP